MVYVYTLEHFSYIDITAQLLRLLNFRIILLQFGQRNEAVIVRVYCLELLSQLMVVRLVALIPNQEADNARLEV